MCGIAGAVGGGAADELSAAVARMVAAERHRGPDDRQVLVVPGAPSVVLGFARLAILDPSEHGRQPMRHAATGSWLVFNGEIYNYRSLRTELAALGHRFRSSGDTEVLLAALVAWGASALVRLRGMYAFAFFDGRRRELLLGRDPFGTKPLLWGRIGRGVLFASELRAIRTAGLGPLTLDRRALDGYLRFGAVPEPHTMAREVDALPPGHVLRLDPAGTPLESPTPVVTLATLRELPERAHVPLARAVAETRAVLEDAVAAHLASDVPVGVLLSSGVDSTLVARLAATGAAAPALTFLTVGLGREGVSEAEAARATAERLGVRHAVLPLTADDVLGALPGVLDAMDQPTADGVNTWTIARAAAAAGIRVLLAGTGGDELFGGYTTFRKAPLLAANAAWLAPLARRLAPWSGGSHQPWSKLARARSVHTLEDAYLLQRALGWVALDGAAGLPAAALSPETAALLATSPSLSAHRRVSYLETAFYLRNQLLRDADVMSAAHSVELRVPFVDLAVLRHAWSLPAHSHLAPFGDGKRVLRRLLADLDPARPPAPGKLGFVLPWAAWMRGALGERVAATVTDAGRLGALGLPADLGRCTLDAFRHGGGDWASPWALFTLLEWQDRMRLGT